MIDPKLLPADPDAWVKPDISQPRTTPEFVNDMWASRKSPVYSLRPLEVAVLQSKTFKGWLWRAAVSVIRHKNLCGWPSDKPAPDPTVTLGKLAAGICPFEGDPEGEASMRHYVAVTEKFHPMTPVLPPETEPKPPHSYWDTMTGAGSITGASSLPKKKPRKKTAKKASPKRKKR